jgi:hypothetical protein
VIGVPGLLLFKYGKPRSYLQDLLLWYAKPRTYSAVVHDTRMTEPYLQEDDGDAS